MPNELLQSLHLQVDPNSVISLLVSLLVGVGLSAACGFRVFIPPLMMSVGAHFFGWPLPENFGWLATDIALVALLSAALIEAAAYYLPWVDHLLDTLAAPAAMIAGTAITGSFLTGQVDPGLQWAIALIAGGGAAGAVQSLTTTTRLASLAATAGLANPVVTTAENILAIGTSTLAIAFPWVAVALGVIALIVSVWVGWHLVRLVQKGRRWLNGDGMPPRVTQSSARQNQD
ncbi:MAG: DUF4126 domain-containing protein [Candidatus Melainabacteria bacterium]